MIKHWAKLSCLVAFGHILAVACTTENDDDDGATTTTSTGTTTTSNSGGTGGDGGTGGNGGGNGGSAGDPTTTTSSTTAANGGTSSGGTAGGAGDGNEAGTAGAAGGSTDGYDGDEINELAGPETVTNGGTFTIQATIPGADDEQTFSVAVNGEAGENVTATPNDDGVFDITFTVPDDADGDTVIISITPLDSDGDAGLTRDFDSELVKTGTGDLKVTLSFDQGTDLDLYLLEPGDDGEQISFDNPTSAAGGELDLDSNPECSPVDGVNIENIFYSADAPTGRYLVGVDYYQACVEATVNYTVTVTVEGEVQETFTGSFTADQAGGEVRTVGEFTIE